MARKKDWLEEVFVDDLNAIAGRSDTTKREKERLMDEKVDVASARLAEELRTQPWYNKGS